MSTEKRGPIAPKDPTVKRQGFYIMKNKSILGNPQPDNRGVCFIYEDSGRLEASAKLVGNVTDEKILSLMGTVEGIRTLVHSIGVSIKTEGKGDEAVFAFQMYGHTDPYVSGTTINMEIPADGMEFVINLEDVDWSDDDNVPGQIRFEFDKPETSAEVSVILYLNDGFEAPPQSEDEPIDLTSDKYKKIIEKSLISMGNNHRVKKALEKARRGEEVTLGFIGGSITQGAGAVPINTQCYTYQAYLGFKEMVVNGPHDGPDDGSNIHYSKAGVGGTPSELGMLRYEQDILKDGRVEPDIVVVEFAVNDEGDETKGECYDSLVRKIYNGPGKPAVILMYAVFANDWNLEERLCIVGETYNLPMVSARRAVVEQFYQTRENGNVLSKNQFFYDLFHPTNAGHRIMADAILNMMRIADASKLDEEKSIDNIKPPIGGDFENVKRVDRTHSVGDSVVSPGAFDGVDKDIQLVERDLDLVGTPQFPDNWMYSGNGNASPLTMDVTCRNLLVIFKDSASAEVGLADVYVDGKLALEMNPHEVGWTHCDPRIIYRSDVSEKHHVEIKVKENSLNKSFTILGFGVVE